jgi:hypothetical protein
MVWKVRPALRAILEFREARVIQELLVLPDLRGMTASTDCPVLQEQPGQQERQVLPETRAILVTLEQPDPPG